MTESTDRSTLKGQHHVSAMTADARANYDFYTKKLGMRLVKKTVNQDDTSVYHLFYADERGNPGTDLTFFELPKAAPFVPGTNAITLTSLRVAGDDSIRYWRERFEQLGVAYEETLRAGRKTLLFRDPEGQRLAIVSDESDAGVPSGRPWAGAPIAVEHGIRGLGPVELTVSRLERTAEFMIETLGYRKLGTSSPSEAAKTVTLATGMGGNGAEVHLVERADLPRERYGRGAVHHVAFRVEDEAELRRWIDRLTEAGVSHSGFVERYYFKSLYFREPNGILFELATDGPGFEGDEPFERLGERLSLPPYLEHDRTRIESGLAPLDTRGSSGTTQ